MKYITVKDLNLFKENRLYYGVDVINSTIKKPQFSHAGLAAISHRGDNLWKVKIFDPKFNNYVFNGFFPSQRKALKFIVKRLNDLYL